MGDNNQGDFKSVSRLTTVLEVQGRGSIEYELVRHFAPLTVSRVVKALPITDTVHFYDNKFAYINTQLQIGGEKPRTSFRLGDIAFQPNSSSVCFFLHECRVSPMNLMGTAKSSIAILSQCNVGDILTFKK